MYKEVTVYFPAGHFLFRLDTIEHVHKELLLKRLYDGTVYQKFSEFETRISHLNQFNQHNMKIFYGIKTCIELHDSVFPMAVDSWQLLYV